MKWMPFEMFMALRYLQPKRTFVSVITIISVLGVTLGVMVLILVISVMSGFARELREKILGMNAHIKIENGAIIRDPEAVMRVVQADPGVSAASPYVMGPVLINFMGRISTPYLRGIDPEKERDVSRLQRYVTEGEYALGDDEVIIGAELARQTGLMVGDKFLVYSPRNLGGFLRKPGQKEPEEHYLPGELQVTGIFSSGMFEYDVGLIFVNLPTAQRLYNMNGGIHGVTVMTPDPFRATEVKDRLNTALDPPAEAKTWMQLNRRFLQALATEKSVMFILLTFIVLVAAFGIMSTLITVTVQKTHEIGLMKALGASSLQILWIFVAQGLTVGLIGTVLGLVSGLLVVEFRNPLRDFLGRAFGWEVFPREIYLFSEIPAMTRWEDVTLICSVSIVICTLAGVVPALLSARLQPAVALRRDY